MRNLFGDKKTIAMLVSPGVLVLLFAMVVPIGFSFYYSLTDWAGFGESTYVGLANYAEILGQDPVFGQALVNVLLLILATVFIQNPIAFVLAAILARLSQRFSRVLRMVYFIPAVLSVVVISKLWMHIMNPTYGILDKALRAIGLDQFAVSWLSDPSTALGSVIFIITWQGFGWALLFFYTGLMTVPKELEEAARVDGANLFVAYRRVIIPYMLPVIASVLTIDVISCMKQMEIVFLTTEGGPGSITQFVSVYLYQKAFSYSQYGYGNALSVLYVIIAVGITLLLQRLFRTEGEIN